MDKKVFCLIAATTSICLAVFLFIWFSANSAKSNVVFEPDPSLSYAFFSKAIDKTLNSAGSLIKETVSLAEKTILGNRILPDFTILEKEFLEKQIDFIEVNLEKMQVLVYKKGAVEKEMPILAKGVPDRWGGTPSGLYQIISGSKTSYSNSVSLYMPWALRFYGKYYIHGEPYYQNKEKYQSEFTGGCLRLADQDVEALYQLAELKMPLLVIDKINDDYFYPIVSAEGLPALSAESYLAADLNSGFVLLAKNPDMVWPIASLTKWMTAVVLTEQIGFTRKIGVYQSMLDLGYSSTDCLDKCAEEGASLGVVELLYPLLIQSSNDAAFVLSSFFGVSRTVQMMNEKAESILMPNTHFACPSGYDSANVSTAKDFYYLARYIYNVRPALLEISKGKQFGSFPLTTCQVGELWNKNIFVNDDAFVGGKTGYIVSSGYNGVFIFNFTDSQGEERPIVIILLGSKTLEQRKRDVQRIYIWLKKTWGQVYT